jgi:hypothetical protein
VCRLYVPSVSLLEPSCSLSCILGETKAFIFLYASIFNFFMLFLLLIFTHSVGCSNGYSYVCSVSCPKYYVNEVRVFGYDCFALCFNGIFGSYYYVICVLKIYLFRGGFLVICA